MKMRFLNNLLRYAGGGGGRKLNVITTSPFSTRSSSSSCSVRCTNAMPCYSGSNSVTSTGTSTYTTFSSSINNYTWTFSGAGESKRWKHAGKIGHKVEKLKEIAHRPEKEAAQERRKKKKERKAAKNKRGNRGKKENEETSSSSDDSYDAVSNIDANDTTIDENQFNFDEEDDEIKIKGDENESESDEPSLPDPLVVRKKMDAVVDKFRESFKSIRGAEPTADMFDNVTVQAYGAPTPLNAVAQVVITSPTLAQVTCFDPDIAKDVVKAVQLTLELNPQIEEGGGGNIRIPLPRVSMEVREKLSKSVKKRAETCKQRLRVLRRKAMDDVKKGKDGKIPGISKDDAFSSGKEIETVSESVMEALDSIVAEKMNSIMAI